MDFNSQRTIVLVSLSLGICIVEFFFQGFVWGGYLWLIAYAAAIDLFITYFRIYNRFLTHDIGVARGRYWIKIVLVLLYVMSIIGLSIVDLMMSRP